MNGVRRFLGAAGLSDTQTPGPPAPLDLGSPPSSATPLTSASSASAYSNPSTSSASPYPIQIKSPTTTTAALFLKKKDKTRPSQGSQSISGSVDEASSSAVLTRARSNTGSSSSSASGLTKKSGSGPILRNTRDELLLSLLASEAVVESRDFEILSSEEVDELKKEESILASRLNSLQKRLETERKIRDAALTLSTLSPPRNSGSKSASVGGNEQLDAASKRFDETQKEVWRISQAKSDITRRLVEHRAGVLGESVRRIEQGNRDSASGYTTPNPSSPASTTFNFFAGHPSSAVPTATSILPQAAQQQISQLEEQLRAATASLSEASKKQAETSRELSLLKLEKEQVETMLGLEIQAAQDKAASLDRELPGLEEEIENLRREKELWEEERDLHQDEKAKWENERGMFEEMQQAKGGSDALLAEVRQGMLDLREQLGAKDNELGELQSQLSQTQSQLAQLERTHAETAEDLDSGRSFIQSLVQTHAIVLFSRDSSLKGLIGAIGTHLENLSTKLLSIEQASAQKEIEHRQREAEWETQKRRLEEDVRAGFDKREQLSRELDAVRREREDARKEVRDQRDSSVARSPMSPTNGQHFNFPPTPSTPTRSLSNSPHSSLSSAAISTAPDTSEFTSPEALSILSALKTLWMILPSPEARAAKFASSRERAFRAGTGPSSPTIANAPASPSGATPKSISDLDVRSLKSLYDSTTKNPSSLSSPQSEFTLQSFISRVQSLLNDDRLLIERLLRFAQAHDLLKKNAERAQKLASDANSALETYQRQVRVLEDRNADLVKRCAELQGEVSELQGLQEVVDRISAAKSDIEVQAAEQAETCRQLTEANNVLSARALALAEEAAQAPDMMRRQMQKEIDDMKAKLAATEVAGGAGSGVSAGAQAALQAELDKAKKELKEALEGMEAMRTSGQAQNVMLMDELMVTQTENAELKNQLRALKK
ncbi:hypothetical protein GYMLUDRAFT_36395 [Collybiopsis luxurians FD-317 M1]|nr:hypothetical protein GYMLUDRAFT_36395 [Collybiopsis luxurians FD-317 M1]